MPQLSDEITNFLQNLCCEDTDTFYILAENSDPLMTESNDHLIQE